MTQEASASATVFWRLLYTKPRCELWAEANLKKQGFEVLLPRLAGPRGMTPLFPRYVFARPSSERMVHALTGTFGISRVIFFGDQPARVPGDVIEEIRARMDGHGIVRLESAPEGHSLFAKRERDRLRTIAKLVDAGFRVRAA